MRWQDPSDGFSAFVMDDLDLDAAIHFANVSDRADSLFPEEADELERMAPKRQEGFSTGRWCAHQAQRTLGFHAGPVLRHERAPIWPHELFGSISHTDNIAAAAVSRKSSIGLDLEQLDRVHEGLYQTLFTENEVKALEGYGEAADTIMFSAKESGYKAIFPIGQQFIGFHEAEIELDEVQQSFAINYLGEHEPNKALNSGVGFWRIANGHVHTVFVIE